MSYDYQTADPLLYRLLKKFASYNRNHPTEAEALLWAYLRADALGVTFKRQHVIGEYIADFVCLSSKLIIELDGSHHQLPQQQCSDQKRTEWLESKGYRVIRFTNNELFNNMDIVLETIKEYIL
ncbi:MAG: endonuclease domain-containing protein [Prevotella sp.]|nr:endonuclease domain-containing protein [Prevotella sp.]